MSYVDAQPAGSIPIDLVKRDNFAAWQARLSAPARAWVKAGNFRAEPDQHVWLPDENGNPARVAVGYDGSDTNITLGSLAMRLAEGVYHLTSCPGPQTLIGWGLGAYQFTVYKKAKRPPAQLVLNSSDGSYIRHTVEAMALARDLINTPASDMLPTHLAEAAQNLAARFGARSRVIVGDDLLTAGHRTIHAVGRASADAPRLIDIAWGKPENPAVVLVGKGICFDSGGLDIKPAAGMRSMKKDMGGAATALGLACLIMAENLPVCLRVLIPAAENAISSNAYRPGDVIRSYNGRTIEIDNTDAEGRLVLCDALALAAEAEPRLIVDFATLTGAARAAVGAEIGAMFSNNTEIADAIYAAGRRDEDDVWRMPLHQPYKAMLESSIADTVNSASSPYAGAITAALFLEQFIGQIPWVHFDIMAFNTRTRPAHPEGGEAMGLRAVFKYLRETYGG
ncbi:MAG: leucyl aminopeptidase family protein [Proteobacteria bacterium]|nr:leucyl aminopeptidase family protein [Pseudomonadota bacterium]